MSQHTLTSYDCNQTVTVGETWTYGTLCKISADMLMVFIKDTKSDLKQHITYMRDIFSPKSKVGGKFLLYFMSFDTPDYFKERLVVKKRINVTKNRLNVLTRWI